MEHLIQLSKHVRKHPPTFENTHTHARTVGLTDTSAGNRGHYNHEHDHMPGISSEISHFAMVVSPLYSVKENYRKRSENKAGICSKPKGRGQVKMEQRVGNGIGRCSSKLKRQMLERISPSARHRTLQQSKAANPWNKQTVWAVVLQLCCLLAHSLNV